jgi:hypothetical protein
MGSVFILLRPKWPAGVMFHEVWTRYTKKKGRKEGATPTLSEIEYWHVLKQRILLRKLESRD